jgi:hypothetical protein
MIKAKVLSSETPDEFTALRDFGPYIIWVMRDSATRLDRARQQGYTDQRAIDSIATRIADFYMTVQLLDPVIQSRCDALGIRRRQTWMDALPADYHHELQNIHMPLPRLRTKTAEKTETPPPQLDPTPPRRTRSAVKIRRQPQHLQRRRDQPTARDQRQQVVRQRNNHQLRHSRRYEQNNLLLIMSKDPGSGCTCRSAHGQSFGRRFRRRTQ